MFSALPPIVLQKSFAGSVKNSEGRWRVLRVMIRGTSSPCAKFMGDFGSATEAVQIIDLFSFQVFAKNFDRCNFRVLQHNPADSGHSWSGLLKVREAVTLARRRRISNPEQTAAQVIALAPWFSELY